MQTSGFEQRLINMALEKAMKSLRFAENLPTPENLEQFLVCLDTTYPGQRVAVADFGDAQFLVLLPDQDVIENEALDTEIMMTAFKLESVDSTDSIEVAEVLTSIGKLVNLLKSGKLIYQS